MKLIIIACVLLLVGCVKKGPSEVCEDGNECRDDLSCLNIGVEEGGSCRVFSAVCTEACSTDADCADLAEDGEQFRCLSQCDGSQICGQTQQKTTDLPASAVCETTEACAEGLQCLPVSEHVGEQCTDVGMACSTPCETNEDCTALGANFECFEGCGAQDVCGARG